MIRIDGDTFYISAGEACYIFKIVDGMPTHIYFGKRVEPEDDLSALGCGGIIKELTVQAVIDGKKKDVDFALVEAWVAKDNDGNDKSLVVELRDETAKLKATMYYTPHQRGGIFRRVVIKHTDSDDFRLALVRQSVGYCGIENTDGKSNGFFAMSGNDNGDAYGFLCPDGDGNVAVKDSTVTCDVMGDITLYDIGEELECPTLLCVYSDIGRGGVSRVFHDILREDEGYSDLSERAAVLFLPKMYCKEIVAAVKATGELGFGVVALDGGRHTKDELSTLGLACRENGLIAGLRINREFIEVDSAFRTNACKQTDSGVYKYDNSDKQTAMLYHAVRYSVANYDIKYVMIETRENATSSDVARGMFAIKNMLKNEFDGLRVDFGLPSDEMRKEYTAYYPLMYMRNIVTPDPPENFKTRFDVASLGTLGYEFNPIELSDGLKRAVRAQILSYQDDARCVLRGDLYSCGDGTCSMAVRKDKSRAYAVCVSKGERVKFFGLDEHNLYHVRELNKTFSGAALIHCGIAVGE
ncbi:MAG: GH36 C-terminal domain-containing protein, partial [Clostridiales bacterium]|nr:GH36 C-terminal domain-containing protein [Clostridiales bacterium]